MIFRPELAEKILAGEKTQTRRAVSDNPRSPWWVERCRYRVGRHYAIQPGRGKRSIGTMVVTDVRCIRLSHMDEGDARAEGFNSVAEFSGYWKAMHGSFDGRALVWRVSFRLAP